jgi:hypothetical protein
MTTFALEKLTLFQLYSFWRYSKLDNPEGDDLCLSTMYISDSQWSELRSRVLKLKDSKFEKKQLQRTVAEVLLFILNRSNQENSSGCSLEVLFAAAECSRFKAHFTIQSILGSELDSDIDRLLVNLIKYNLTTLKMWSQRFGFEDLCVCELMVCCHGPNKVELCEYIPDIALNISYTLRTRVLGLTSKIKQEIEELESSFVNKDGYHIVAASFDLEQLANLERNLKNYSEFGCLNLDINMVVVILRYSDTPWWFRVKSFANIKSHNFFLQLMQEILNQSGYDLGCYCLKVLAND